MKGDTPSVVPILMYHEVTPEPDPRFARYTVTPQSLEWQMGWLRKHGYRSIRMDDLLDARAGRASLPEHPIVITFDDGLRDAVSFAPPILERHGFTAIFYLVAGLAGRPARWLLTEIGFDPPLIDWREARGLEAAGFECGSHTMSHPRLAMLTPEACRAELDESRRLLSDQLGRDIVHLAYPFGSFDAAVERLAQEAGYLSACTTSIGFSGLSDRPLALSRVPILGSDSRLDFVWRMNTAHNAAGWLGTAPWKSARRLWRPR